MAARNQPNFLIKLLIILVIGIIIFAIIDMQVKMNDLLVQKSEIQAEIDKTSDRVEEMRIRLNTPFDEEYMERLAREKLNYRKEGELLFINDIAD